MKLLLDENISFRVVHSIEKLFPGSIHVSALEGLREDWQIFSYARSNDFIIVTFDEDFFDLQLVKGHPPKIIWLRFGNSTNQKLASKILSNHSRIVEFFASENGLLEIY